MPRGSGGPQADIDTTRPGNFTLPPDSLNPPAPVPQAPRNESPEPQPQMSGVPGVTLKCNVYESNSATLLSERRNVHVPDGAQMQIAIGVIPKGVHLRQLLESQRSPHV
ncbi:MAG TPA: hypothetical protein VME18_10780 [Acidobacteriaceae bacterium]|nr:hypothetical protein [Acidobacteriaceae bacterium]